MKMKLILENKMEFEGTSFGFNQEVAGEVVFNTSMNGYQEIITDPASSGQILVMTSPLIGNYGINLDDSESDQTYIKALVVSERCIHPNNFRCELTLDDYLKSQKIMGIEGIDTRALTKVLRTEGTMKGIIVSQDNQNKSSIEAKFKESVESSYTSEIVHANAAFTNAAFTAKTQSVNLSVMDFGLTNSTLEKFKEMNCQIKIYPSTAKASEILLGSPDMVLLSSGSENIEQSPQVLEEIKLLAQSKPLVGIGNGHLLIAKAFGGNLTKHSYGHRGKQPVKNLLSGKVSSSTQNHSYHVNALPQDFEITHINLNDHSIEGIKHKTLPVMSVQFYPESHTSSNFCDGMINEFLKLAHKEMNHA